MTAKQLMSYAQFMLDYARQRALEALQISRTAFLATTGPAGLQLSEFPCEAIGLGVYLLLPKTSDHLFNLEDNETATLLTSLWEMHGKAKVVTQGVADLDLLQKPGCEWSVLVYVEPSKIQIRQQGGWGNAETIDLSPGFDG